MTEIDRLKVILLESAKQLQEEGRILSESKRDLASALRHHRNGLHINNTNENCVECRIGLDNLLD
jgi:hypothetical protein